MNRGGGGRVEAKRAVLGAAVALGIALAALWLLAACANPWQEGIPDARLGENCTRTSTAGPRTRVINYVDPELCGRQVARRGPYHVRTRPMPMMGETQGR
jgi:hypothetical protein